MCEDLSDDEIIARTALLGCELYTHHARWKETVNQIITAQGNGVTCSGWSSADAAREWLKLTYDGRAQWSTTKES